MPAVNATIQVINKAFLFGEQFVGRKVFFIFVTGMLNAWQRFTCRVNEASGSLFEKRTGVSSTGRVLNLGKLIFFDDVIDAAINLLTPLRPECFECLPDRLGFKPRNTNVHKMSVQTACPRRLARLAALCVSLKISFDPPGEYDF